MSEHTPGPWYVRWKDNGFPRAVRTGSRGVAAPMWTDENGDPNPEESAANARLIAASPDLLKAAKNVVTAATENSRATYEVAGGPFEDLIDAIAKAESDDV